MTDFELEMRLYIEAELNISVYDVRLRIVEESEEDV